MADEDIVIIEDSSAIDDADVSDATEESASKSNRKKIILFALIAFFLLIIITLLLFLLLRDKSSTPQLDMNKIEKELNKKSPPPIEPSKLENMIAKANYLYTNGSQVKALSLYANIAQYSEAISAYNLGVAELKNGQYKLARKTFSKAIQNNEKRCVSAINAAVCSLHLHDKENFHYYIDLAYAYLPYETNSPLYAYYYTLISYYNQDYFSALNALKNSNSKEYISVHKNLTATLNALYGNDYSAIDAIEKNYEFSDDFSLGLLYARVGNFSLATSHFKSAIMKNIQPLRAQFALGLIELKSGQIADATEQIKEVTQKYPNQVYNYYPIRVKLNDALFDADKAQTLYREKILHMRTTLYQKIFAFSPYKIYNANKTISYIRKGNANIYIDNIASAKKYLTTSLSSSSINFGITQAIKKALNLRIRQANKELQALAKEHPKYSILQYNLALTYAQMGNMTQANKHFLRSYYLDAKNYLSGVYAVMTSQLLNKDAKKLKSILLDTIHDDAKEGASKELYKTLLYINDNNYIAAENWLDKDYKQRPLYLVLDAIIALKLHKYEKAKESTSLLTTLLPHEILPHLIYIDAHFGTLENREYARKVLNYLKKKQFTFNDLYYGPTITRYLYIQENLITGKLYYLREQLKSKLAVSKNQTEDIESDLALVSLYEKQFEESYTLYNHLIDESHIQDAKTLFLGAVASTAAGHHANAIALLELAKLKNSEFYESRYALALLYMEIKNSEAATIQLSKIKESAFKSQYFDFDIDTNKLLFRKNHPTK